MTVPSIPSQVVFGCAGNGAAVPVRQARGHDGPPVPTALPSSIPHHPTMEGGPLPADLVRGLLATSLESRKGRTRCR
jgi:pyridoxine kinase